MPQLVQAPPFTQWSDWTPFGLLASYIGAGADTTGHATPTSQFQQYRDLTLDGTMLCGFSPQFIICRKLDMAGNIIDGNRLGANGRDRNLSTGIGMGGIGALYSAVNTLGFASTASSVYDLLSNLCAPGGGGGVFTPTAGVNGTAATIKTWQELWQLIQAGCIGGGGGGGGSAGTAGGTAQSAGGLRGGAGKDAGTGTDFQDGGGGGSGIGGGGGGGGNSSGQGTGGDDQNDGDGGGIVVLICDEIVGTAGMIRANGGAGTTNTTTNTGGPGGGGGGAVAVFARKIVNAPTLQANGGAGRAGIGTGTKGGDGGAGFTQLVRG